MSKIKKDKTTIDLPISSDIFYTYKLLENKKCLVLGNRKPAIHSSLDLCQEVFS